MDNSAGFGQLPSAGVHGQSGVMQKVQDAGYTDQMGQAVSSYSSKAGRMEYQPDRAVVQMCLA